jgi:hypothetical protein
LYSQAIDTTADMLIYSCAGMIPDAEQEAAAAVADATAAGAEGVPVYATTAADPVAAAEAAPEAPHHHHHHHHHHRHMLQTADSEIANGWTVSL